MQEGSLKYKYPPAGMVVEINDHSFDILSYSPASQCSCTRYEIIAGENSEIEDSEATAENIDPKLLYDLTF